MKYALRISEDEASMSTAKKRGLGRGLDALLGGARDSAGDDGGLQEDSGGAGLTKPTPATLCSRLRSPVSSPAAISLGVTSTRTVCVSWPTRSPHRV